MKFFLRYIITNLLNGVCYIFAVFPIKKNRIVCLSHRGGMQYSDSPRYITEYLLEKYPDFFEIIWIVNDPDKFKSLKDKGIKTVKFRSISKIFYMNTASVCITNGSFGFALIKRKNQLRINTLHGGGAYKSNVLMADSNLYAKNMERISNRYNLYLSGCRLSSERNIREEFRYKGEISETGMPRNDIFFKDCTEAIEKVDRYFKEIKECKIVLVAPTWREDNDNSNIKIDYRRLAAILEEKDGGSWKVLLRPHHLAKVDVSEIVQKNKHIIFDASEYPDVQELLCRADLLITDYSSLIWDFSLQGKPILLYTPDLEDYTKTRGFSVVPTEWGLYYCKNNDELIKTIEKNSFNDLKDASKKHLQIFGSFETGKSTEVICERIYGFCRSKREGK